MKKPVFRMWMGGALLLGCLASPAFSQVQEPAALRLEELAAKSKAGKKIQKALAEESWDKARHAADDLYVVLLNQEGFKTQEIATALAFRALAYAGAGEEAAARCRWNAAQDLWPELAGADLSGYGKAGALLKGESPVAKVASAALPLGELKPVVQTAPRFTRSAKKGGFRGGIRMATLVDAQGHAISARPLGPLPFDLEAPARDTVCDWQFPPSGDSAAVIVSGMVTVPFLPFIGLPPPLNWGGHVPGNRSGRPAGPRGGVSPPS